MKGNKTPKLIEPTEKETAEARTKIDEWHKKVAQDFLIKNGWQSQDNLPQAAKDPLLGAIVLFIDFLKSKSEKVTTAILQEWFKISHQRAKSLLDFVKSQPKNNC